MHSRNPCNRDSLSRRQNNDPEGFGFVAEKLLGQWRRLQRSRSPRWMPNVLHYQPCDAAQVTNAHISYHVRNVSFTGSTNIGYITVFTAGKYIKPVLLELGGEASARRSRRCKFREAYHVLYPGLFLTRKYRPPSAVTVRNRNLLETSLAKFACRLSALWCSALL